MLIQALNIEYWFDLLISINCNLILQLFLQIKDIIIPMLETSHRRSEESIFTSSSSSNAESSNGWEILTKINFSEFPKDICNCTEEDLQDMAKQLNEKLTKIQNEFEDIVKPNLKVYNTYNVISYVYY